MQLTDLPAAEPIAAAHSDQLRSVILEKIRAAGGAISFAQYMNSALYEPGLGYYMAGAAKFGAQGDFITGPEISPLFGGALAEQIKEVAQSVGNGVLELGAGSGKLALSIVRSLASNPDFSYFILEPSADLAQRQKQLLQSSLPAEAYQRVHWLRALPDTFDGVVVANEVMDALPVERFLKGPKGLQQLCVADSFSYELRPADASLSKAVAAIENDLEQPFEENYETEVCLLLAPWIQSLAARLKHGVLLLIDYGYPRREYYSAERNRGTLACYYRHRAHDNALHLPGLQDITAHVDFTSVVEAAVSSDMELLGYSSQSAFLLDNNLLELADTMRSGLNSDRDRIKLAQEIKTLTLPGEMGERFQVMALGKGYDLPLQGFRSQDLAYRL